MSNTKPSLNLNTILTSLALIGIIWLVRSVSVLQQDVVSIKMQEGWMADKMAASNQEFDRRIRDLEFKKHGDGL